MLQETRNLLVPIPPAKYEGSVLEVETTLSKFRTYHDAVQKMAMATFQLWGSLSQRLGKAAEVSSEAGCPLDYSPALKTIEVKLAGLKLEWKSANESCVQRETRCKLSLNRVEILQEMEEVIVCTFDPLCRALRYTHFVDKPLFDTFLFVSHYST